MTGTVAKVSKGRVALRKIKPSICAACRHRISRHCIPEDLNEILIKRQSCTCRHLWQFLSAEFVKGGSVMRYVRSRASLLILGVFFLITRILYPNFDHASKNSPLSHEGIQSPHHLPFACDFKFIWVEIHHRKLNYAFKLIVNPSLHLECMLFDIHPRRWLTEACLRLLATKWLCRVFALEAFIITAARI